MSTPVIHEALWIIRRMGCDVQISVVESERSALVEVRDPAAFVRCVERVERALGYRLACTAKAGGVCELVVTEEAL